jgi:two-component system, NarL family, nitrate/nitrite response regulator NarL
MAAPARILIVDDHTLFAEAVKMALGAHGYTVAGIVGSVEDAVPAVRELAPDLVLVDVALPDGNGLALGRTIAREHPGMRVVALSGLDDPSAVKEALQGGLHGYVIKDTPVARLVQAIETVLGGDVVVPRSVSPRVAGARTSEEEAAALLVAQLTPREREVLDLLVQGKSGASIGRSLGISPNTVRTHVQNVLTKLQVRSRLEAATFAVRHRLFDTAERPRSDPERARGGSAR